MTAILITGALIIVPFCILVYYVIKSVTNDVNAFYFENDDEDDGIY